MKRKSIFSGLAILILLFVGLTSASYAELLSGRVYEGEYLSESPSAQGLPNVTLRLYGSHSSSILGDEVSSYTTGSDGWYGLETEQSYEFFTIVCEGKSGYTFNGSFSIGGSASGENIVYVVPLAGKTLMGNKFWYKRETHGPTENNPPVAVDDSYTIGAGRILQVNAPGVLTNDRDPDGDPLRVQASSGPSHGLLAYSQNGSFTYTPNPGFSRTDSFSYRAFDGALHSNVATVTITVVSSEEPPAGEATISLIRHE